MDPDRFSSPSDLQMKSAVHRNDRRYKRRWPLWIWLVLVVTVVIAAIGIAVAVKQ